MAQLQANKPLVIFVEGIISAGKSELLRLLRNQPGLFIVDEPISLWRSFYGSNILDKMYQHPKEWSLTLQSLVQLSLIKNYLLPVTTPDGFEVAKIMARSLFSAKYCFIELLKQQDMLTAEAVNLLEEWLQFLVENFHVKADVIIYVRTDPEIAFERMKKRGRPEEACVSIEYLTKLHELHDKWLKSPNGSQQHTHVIEFDGNGCMADLKKHSLILYKLICDQWNKKELPTNVYLLFLGEAKKSQAEPLAAEAHVEQHAVEKHEETHAVQHVVENQEEQLGIESQEETALE